MRIWQRRTTVGMNGSEGEQRMKLFIATPCYGGMMSCMTTSALLQLQAEASKRGVTVVCEFPYNESLVQRARNRLVHNFMKTDATHLVFVDADIQFAPAWVFTMAESGHDIVAGSYPTKNIDWQGVIHWAKQGKTIEELPRLATRLAINGFCDDTAVPEDQCVEVQDLATGFMCIRREVIEKMLVAHPDTVYLDTGIQEPVYALFDCFIDTNGIYLSEDYGFCRRWQKLGGKAHLYLPAVCNHFGTMLFQGSLESVFAVTKEAA